MSEGQFTAKPIHAVRQFINNPSGFAALTHLPLHRGGKDYFRVDKIAFSYASIS